MRTEYQSAGLRRYVLGAAADEEAAAIEREYFESADALDRVRAAEDDLIDDYVSGQLQPEERQAFERFYRRTPAHGHRVAVARALARVASARSNERSRQVAWWRTAAAAALVLLAVGGAWLRQAGGGRATTQDSPAPRVEPTAQVSPSAAPDAQAANPVPPSSARPTDRAPVVVAISVSPILVRGDHAAAATIAPGTDIVRLRLQGGVAHLRASPTRAVVRTVAGREVWQGRASRPAGRNAAEQQELARIDIPAARLRPDDYVIELRGIDPAGTTIELHQYFLSVRAP
jgi:hypothetical protein